MLYFKTERLLLRSLNLDDAAFILELYNTPKWIAYIGDRGLREVEAARQYLMAKILPFQEKYGFGAWGMALQSAPDVLIGTCGIYKRPELEHPDLGYAILPAYEGKGYTIEACRAVLKIAKEHFDLSTLYAIVLPSNAASVGLLQRLSFQKIGTIHYEEDALDQYALELN